MEVSEAEPTTEEFAQKTIGFQKWFSESYGTRLSQKIQLADLRSRNAGRGVVALQNIAEDEELFSIPRSLVLTATNSDIPREILEAVGSDSAWLPLIVALIYEILLGKSSQWYPYLNILPHSFHTLMFWSDEELAELQASAVVGKIGKSETEEAWNEGIIPLMLENPSIFPIRLQDEKAKRDELKRLAHRAGSLIMAYAFDIDKEEDNAVGQQDDPYDSSLDDEEGNPLKGMVPFADMLNSDANKNNARVFQEDDNLVMKSIKPIQAGNEIFNDYGPLPRSDLLRMYGYITDNYAQYDVAEVSYDLVFAAAKVTTPQAEQDHWLKMEETADDHDLVEDGYTISKPRTKLEDSITGQLHMLLRLFCGGSCKRRGWRDYDAIPNFPFTTQEAQLLAAIMQKRIDEYSTDLTQDQKSLNSIPSEWTSARVHRCKMAIKVRMAEKEIYHAVAQMCKDCIASALAIPEHANGTNKRNRDQDPKSGKTSRKAARKN